MDPLINVNPFLSGEKTWVAIGLTPIDRPNQEGMSLADIYYCQDRPEGLGIESAWAEVNSKFSKKKFSFSKSMSA